MISGLRLKSVEIFYGLACVRRGRKDRPLVVFQHLQTIGEIARVVLATFWRKVQVSTHKRRAKFRYKFFHRVTGVAEAFAA